MFLINEPVVLYLAAIPVKLTFPGADIIIIARMQQKTSTHIQVRYLQSS